LVAVLVGLGVAVGLLVGLGVGVEPLGTGVYAIGVDVHCGDGVFVDAFVGVFVAV
jgi:hypothetical protein